MGMGISKGKDTGHSLHFIVLELWRYSRLVARLKALGDIQSNKCKVA